MCRRARLGHARRVRRERGRASVVRGDATWERAARLPATASRVRTPPTMGFPAAMRTGPSRSAGAQMTHITSAAEPAATGKRSGSRSSSPYDEACTKARPQSAVKIATHATAAGTASSARSSAGAPAAAATTATSQRQRCADPCDGERPNGRNREGGHHELPTASSTRHLLPTARHRCDLRARRRSLPHRRLRRAPMLLERSTLPCTTSYEPPSVTYSDR